MGAWAGRVAGWVVGREAGWEAGREERWWQDAIPWTERQGKTNDEIYAMWRRDFEQWQEEKWPGEGRKGKQRAGAYAEFKAERFARLDL